MPFDTVEKGTPLNRLRNYSCINSCVTEWSSFDCIGNIAVNDRNIEKRVYKETAISFWKLSFYCPRIAKNTKNTTKSPVIIHTA
jgi:hypothetical protein